ncbi:MAG: hypothetical protein RR314_03760, partial [Oscillospiraceae bacterium]
MQSRKSFFNRTLFLKTLTRFWPLWFGYALAWIIMLPVSMASGLARNLAKNSAFADSLLSIAQAQPLREGLGTGVVLSVIFGCLAAMAVYSHLYFTRSAGAYASLPLRRENVFTSVTLAALVPMLVINVLVFLITLLVEAAYGAVYLPALLQWLAIVSMLNLFFFGFAALCAQLTGNLVVLPLVYALLNFAEVIVETIVSNILNTFVYGFSGSGYGALSYLSPTVGILGNCGVSDITETTLVDGVTQYNTIGYSFYGWTALAVYAAVGALFLVGALLLYRRRSMESAGDVVAVNPLRPVFKYCLAAGMGLCLGALLFAITYGGEGVRAMHVWLFILYMSVGCVIGYFAAEMLIKKTFAVFRGGRVWIGCAASCAVLALFLLSFEYDLWGYEKRLPDISAVKTVTLNGFSGGATLNEPENLEAARALHERVIKNKAINEKAEGDFFCSFYLTYMYEDGSVMRRNYGIYDEADIRALQELANTDEAILSRKQLSHPVTSENITYCNVNYSIPLGGPEEYYETHDSFPSPEEMYELYTECILPDLAEHTLGRVWLITDDSYFDNVYAAKINFECGIRDESGGYDYQSFYTVPTVSSVRTNEWLAAHGVELHLEGEFPRTPYDYPEASAAA